MPKLQQLFDFESQRMWVRGATEEHKRQCDWTEPQSGWTMLFRPLTAKNREILCEDLILYTVTDDQFVVFRYDHITREALGNIINAAEAAKLMTEHTDIMRARPGDAAREAGISYSKLNRLRKAGAIWSMKIPGTDYYYWKASELANLG